MSIRIGINPLTWTNDDLPSLGAENSLEMALSEGRQAGYAGFELGNKFPREPAALRQALEPYGLALVSGWYSGRLLARDVKEEIVAIQDHLHLLRALGANVMVFAEVTDCIHGDRDTPVSRRPRMTDAQWKTFGQRLTEVARYTLSQGVRIAYHHHMGTVVESEQDVERLMEVTGDAVGLLLDTGHLTYAGADPLGVAQRHGKRICHVHCKDVRRQILSEVRNRDTSFLDAVLAGVFTVPGDGCIDYLPIFESLKRDGYEGWLVVEAEQDPAIAHPLTYATKGYNYLHKTATQVWGGGSLQ
ncbi:MAG: myo-inosose-2 dehydratase [Chromatiales bacterium]|jgi:inosose dehydratase